MCPPKPSDIAIHESIFGVWSLRQLTTTIENNHQFSNTADFHLFAFHITDWKNLPGFFGGTNLASIHLHPFKSIQMVLMITFEKM